MTDLSLSARRAQVEAFDVRHVHPHLRFGTASDRYAGWIGQVYPERWRDEISTRSKRVGGTSFEEQTLPIASVEDYFEHFSVLEIDFTFYRPLLNADGEAAPNYFVLQQYAEAAPAHARFLLKVPQVVFARTLRRQRDGRAQYVENPDFLNPEAHLRQFHEPAQALLGDRIEGFIFEQGYQRRRDGLTPEENIAALDGFFARLPNDVQAHLELRSEYLLVPPYFDWLEANGLGFVFSYWTWLPPVRQQWRLAGERFTATNRTAVARLLTAPNVKYDEAYALAHPFDRPVPKLADSASTRDMILDAAALTYQAEAHGVDLMCILNNRASGNAPTLAQTIAHRVLDEEERRG